jgi:hypothetical protein
MRIRKTVRVKTLAWDSSHAAWLVERARGSIHPADLYSANFFVGVSLKTASFSNRWLEAVLRDVVRLMGSVTFSVVDGPYFASAYHEIPAPDHEVARERLEKARNQTTTRISAAREQVACRSEIVEWSKLACSVDHEVSSEIRSAFSKRGRFFNAVVAQTELAKGTRMTGSPEAYCSFLLDELPTLIHVYYQRYPGWIDVYPGPNARIIWEIDVLRFGKELPFVSALAEASPPLTHAVVRLTGRGRNESVAAGRRSFMRLS